MSSLLMYEIEPIATDSEVAAAARTWPLVLPRVFVFSFLVSFAVGLSPLLCASRLISVLHQARLEEQAHGVGHLAAGGVGERARSGLLWLSARADPGGAAEPPAVQVVRGAEPAMVRRADGVLDAVRLRWHPVHGDRVQRLVHVDRDRLPQPVRCQPAKSPRGRPVDSG